MLLDSQWNGKLYFLGPQLSAPNQNAVYYSRSNTLRADLLSFLFQPEQARFANHL